MKLHTHKATVFCTQLLAVATSPEVIPGDIIPQPVIQAITAVVVLLITKMGERLINKWFGTKTEKP